MLCKILHRQTQSKSLKGVAHVEFQTDGLIELGGGYRPADIREYFQGLGLQAPVMKSISVDHGHNRPTSAQSADGEVMLDIEVAAAVAPLWAGLVILLNQKLNRRMGFLSPALYNIDQSSGFRDITMGNNCAYSAAYGWDPVTGQRTPVGAQMLPALQGATAPVQTQSQRKETTHGAAAR
jgi:subtilase family serine protease